MRMRETYADALAVPCPRCKAQPGEKCIGRTKTDGTTASRTALHRERWLIPAPTLDVGAELQALLDRNVGRNGKLLSGAGLVQGLQELLRKVNHEP